MLSEGNLLAESQHSKTAEKWTKKIDQKNRTYTSDEKLDKKSNIGYQNSDVRHRTSNVGNKTSNIRHKKYNIKNQTSDIGEQTSDRTSDFGHQTSGISHPTSDIDITHQKSVIRQDIRH